MFYGAEIGFGANSGGDLRAASASIADLVALRNTATAVNMPGYMADAFYDNANINYGTAPSTSYANTLGQGNRVGSITVTLTPTWYTGTGNSLIDGDTATNGPYADTGDNLGKYALFYLGTTKRYFDEVTMITASTPGGTPFYKVQGSVDGLGFFDLSAPRMIASATQVFSLIYASKYPKGWNYMRYIGCGGGPGDYHREMQMKINVGTVGGFTDFADYYNRNAPVVVAHNNIDSTGVGTGYNWAVAIPAASISASGTKCRVMFKAHPTQVTTFTAAYIGQRNPAGTTYSFLPGSKVAITMDGSTTFSVPPGKIYWSDEISFVVDNTKDHSIAFNISAGSSACSSSIGLGSTGWTGWELSGTGDSGTDAKTGYTSGSYARSITDIAVTTAATSEKSFRPARSYYSLTTTLPVYNTYSGIYVSQTVRMRIAASQISQTGRGCRIQIAAYDSGFLQIDNCFIQAAGTGANFASTPVRVKFNGNNGVRLAQYDRIYSDDIDLPIASSTDYIISYYIASGSLPRAYGGVVTGYDTYTKSGDDTSTVTTSGYSLNASSYYSASVSAFEIVKKNDMDIVVKKNTAASVPTKARAVAVIAPLDSGTAGTDYKIRATRDDGANWVEVSTYNNAGSASGDGFPAGSSYIYGDVDFSAAPSGSDVKFDVVNLNNRNNIVGGIAGSWA